jgi:hypothetical protein
MEWYRVKILSADPNAASRAKQLQDRFHTIFNAMGLPRDVAMFGSRDAESNYVLYFSPGAVQIARTLLEGFGGEPIEAPLLVDDIHLLVGHPAAREAMLQKPPWV